MSSESRPTVLVIDDEQGMRSLLCDALEPTYQVETAASGEAALERLGKHVDVVLLDRRMPGMSGEEFLEQIREQGFDVPVAVVTAVHPDFDIIDMSLDNYIIKPFSPGELHDIIETMIKHGDYNDVFKELFRVSAKIEVLKSERPSPEIQISDEYAALLERHDQLIDEAQEALDSEGKK